MRNLTFILLSFFFLTNCVSVNLNDSKISKAKNIYYEDPSKPFISHSSPYVDAVWKNPNNGNSISLFTECDNAISTSLKSIQSSVLSGVQNLNIEKSNYEKLLGLQTLKTLANGDVDGIATQIDMLTFRNDNCIYVISYVASQNNFKTDLSLYNQFITQVRLK